MTKAFENELARALGRADIGELTQLRELHHRWSNFEGNRDKFLEEHDELDAYFWLDSDPDRRWRSSFLQPLPTMIQIICF